MWRRKLADVGYRFEEDDPDFDAVSSDGRCRVVLRSRLSGARDLDAIALRLARRFADTPDLPRTSLVARFDRMSAAALGRQWIAILGVLRPTVAAKLAVVLRGSDGIVVHPESDVDLLRLRDIVASVWPRKNLLSRRTPESKRWTSKSFEVWKVLLDAWLRCEGPIPIGMVGQRSGCSQSTVREALEQLRLRDELSQASNRSVVLSGFPRRSLGEIAASAGELRRSQGFVDATGRSPDPLALLERIRKRAPASVLVAGVVAARHYMPDFGLNGTPRIDVVTHGETTLDWVERVDAGLRPAKPEETPQLVVHRRLRPEAEFESAAMPPRIADPAETLLDLYALRLDAEAEDFVKALRARAMSDG